MVLVFQRAQHWVLYSFIAFHQFQRLIVGFEKDRGEGSWLFPLSEPTSAHFITFFQEEVLKKVKTWFSYIFNTSTTSLWVLKWRENDTGTFYGIKKPNWIIWRVCAGLIRGATKTVIFLFCFQTPDKIRVFFIKTINLFSDGETATTTAPTHQQGALLLQNILLLFKSYFNVDPVGVVWYITHRMFTHLKDSS